MRKWTARQMLVMPKLLNKSSHLTQVIHGVTHPPFPFPLDCQQTFSSQIGWGSAEQAQLCVSGAVGHLCSSFPPLSSFLILFVFNAKELGL